MNTEGAVLLVLMCIICTELFFNIKGIKMSLEARQAAHTSDEQSEALGV